MKINILLTSYSHDSSLSEEVNKEIQLRKKLLLKHSGKNFSFHTEKAIFHKKKIQFIEEWKPGMTKSIDYLLIPKEVNNKRNLKILWATASKIPIIDDTIFFIHKNKINKTLPRIESYELDRFIKPKQNFFSNIGNPSLIRFYANGCGSQKFKMEFTMLKEVCKSLNINLKEDALNENAESADIVLIPTVTKTILVDHYINKKIVKAASICCVTEKFFFDCIQGIEGQFSNTNPEIIYTNINSKSVQDMVIQNNNSESIETKEYTSSSSNLYISSNDEYDLEVHSDSHDDSQESLNIYNDSTSTKSSDKENISFNNQGNTPKRKRSFEGKEPAEPKRLKITDDSLNKVQVNDSDLKIENKIIISEQMVIPFPESLNNEEIEQQKRDCFILTESVIVPFKNNDSDKSIQ